MVLRDVSLRCMYVAHHHCNSMCDSGRIQSFFLVLKTDFKNSRFQLSYMQRIEFNGTGSLVMYFG